MLPLVSVFSQHKLRRCSHRRHDRRRFAFAVLMFTLAFTFGCAAREIVQTTPRVAEATATIKAALIDHPEVDAAAILVEQTDNVITLSGFVDSVANKNTAVKIASDVSQRRVIDKLEVK